MFDFNDYNDVVRFKKRLKETRIKRGFTQDQFAEELHDNNRSRVANWESQKSKTILKVQDFPNICKALGVDPNYLLGVSDIECADDQAISERIHLSSDNVKTLSKEPLIGNFLDFLMSSDQFETLIGRIDQICSDGFYFESIETTFSPYAIKQLTKAFKRFSQEVPHIDMNEKTFFPYVRKAFPWNDQKELLGEFLRSIVIDERYYKMLTSNPDFMNLSEPDKYDALMWDISLASFKHLMAAHLTELARYDVKHIFSQIVDEYVEETVSKFKNREKN